MKPILKSKEADALSCYLVFRPDGTYVARVLARYGSGGGVTVEVHHMTGSIPGAPWYPNQSKRAAGYGYDKFTAALSGMTVDGHTLYNHCTPVPDDCPDGPGVRVANAGHPTAEFRCYVSGLDMLSAHGYRVIQAL